jgi:hypothetical protein
MDVVVMCDSVGLKDVLLELAGYMHHTMRWFQVRRNILDCSYREHKIDSTIWDKTYSISSFIQ